jgi:hypothetical protein
MASVLETVNMIAEFGQQVVVYAPAERAGKERNDGSRV